MKKIILFSTMSFLFLNCETNDENKEAQQSSFNNRVASGKITTYYDNGGTDYGCKGPALDCLPEVIVTPNKASFVNTIKPLMDAVKIENSSLVKDIFANRQADLLDYFEQDVINFVIDGNLFLTIKSKLDVKEHYFIFIDLNKNVKRVYPIFE